MYPTDFEIKDTTESITSAFYLDLLLSIGRNDQLHNSITTSAMIAISTSQTFRSWVVIFHLRRPMSFFYLSLYDTPERAPRMNILFWEPGDFPVSFLIKQGYLVERLKSSFRKFYGWYGDFIQQYEVSLSRNLNDPWLVTVTSQLIRISTNDLDTEHASMERLPFRTPGSIPFFGLAYAMIIETSFHGSTPIFFNWYPTWQLPNEEWF